MMPRSPRPVAPSRPAVLAGLAALVLCAGCGGGTGEAPPPPRADAGAGAQVAVVDTTPPTFPDEAPRELQLPRPVRRALTVPAESWTLAWRLALPTLRLDQFARTGTSAFPAEETSAFDGSVEGADLRLLHLVVPSPDVMLVLDPFVDLELERQGDVVRARRGDEPGAVLVDLRQKTERKLLALPAGARVDGACWLDDTRVVTLVDEPARGGRRPALYLLDVKREVATHYAGPVAGPGESRAARAELDRRFRAARPGVVF